MHINLLPPYGLSPDFYREPGEGFGRIPADWPGANTPAGEKAFDQWRHERLEAIRDHLWPEWVDGVGWQGGSAPKAYAMTVREIDVMTREFSKTDILDRPPTGAATGHTHHQHFEFEDGRTRGDILNELRGRVRNDPNYKPPIGVNFFYYDPTLGESEQEEFLDAVKDSYENKTNKFYFWFKSRLMRPRPYQVALMMGQRDFTSKRAATAMHSAIVSGHATTGIIIRCGALERWLNKGSVPEDRLKAFKQYIMDVGDRRVFAGVHYPTDNISSWTLALTLIPKIFSNADGIGTIVRSAIREHSGVYEVINRVYRKDADLAHAAKFLDPYLEG